MKTSVLHSSPYEWLRTDFDRPSPELSSARRSLVMKLDLVTKRKSRHLCICLLYCMLNTLYHVINGKSVTSETSYRLDFLIDSHLCLA